MHTPFYNNIFNNYCYCYCCCYCCCCCCYFCYCYCYCCCCCWLLLLFLLLLLLVVVVVFIVIVIVIIVVVIIVAIIVIVILDNEFAGPESSEDEELCSRLRQNIQHKKLSRTRKCRLSKKISSMLRLVLNEADINSDEELAVLTSAMDKLDVGKKYLNSLKKDR